MKISADFSKNLSNEIEKLMWILKKNIDFLRLFFYKNLTDLMEICFDENNPTVWRFYDKITYLKLFNENYQKFNDEQLKM